MSVASVFPEIPKGRLFAFEAPFVFADTNLYREIINARNHSQSDSGTTSLELRICLEPYGFAAEGKLCDATPNALMLRESKTQDWICFIWTPMSEGGDWMFKATRNPRDAMGTVQHGWAPKCRVSRILPPPQLLSPTPRYPPPSIPPDGSSSSGTV